MEEPQDHSLPNLVLLLQQKTKEQKKLDIWIICSFVSSGANSME